MASRFRAHLTGMQVIALDASVIALPEPLIVLENEETFAHERHGWWDALCRRSAIEGTWEVRRGVHRRVLAQRASLADVLIGRNPRSNAGIAVGTALLARVLMSRVAPVVLVPDDSAPSSMRRLLVGWNGSAVSTRAIRAALPFLARARKVTILAGDKGRRTRHGDADASLRAWLGRHSVIYDWVELAPSEQPAEAMLGCAEQTRCDAVVMGAWGRSRLREMALGGTTRTMLAHARLPLFLSA
ncbi:universal stress protein [Luteibacter sp. UNCMF331Sha3.1]|uniref:universal stress protein n=1 Tax=Luteibacter sp. UNCMF331Sha3.1 TaxID=1502760 RepID=UPI001480D20F|nr:universal stress protein [Luteibacter sp. UNCMF331Sha3.1]